MVYLITKSNFYYYRTRLYLGPKRFPLIGSYMEVRKLRKKLVFLHLVWDHFSKYYGEVFSVKLGLVEAVIVSGNEMVQYVMRSDSFDGRPDGFVFRLRSFNNRLGASVDMKTLGRVFNINLIYLII